MPCGLKEDTVHRMECSAGSLYVNQIKPLLPTTTDLSLDEVECIDTPAWLAHLHLPNIFNVIQ